MDLEQIVRDQEADFQRVSNVVEAVENRINALDQNLRPEVLAQRVAAIREEGAENLKQGLLNDTRTAMVKRVEMVQAEARKFTPEGERRLARFHDDASVNATMQIAAFTRLARTPTPELITHLEDAIDAGNLAMAEAVRLEFGTRGDAQAVQDEWRAAFGKLTSPKAELAQAAINRVMGLKSMADERALVVLRGRGSPVDRINAARQMGSKAA